MKRTIFFLVFGMLVLNAQAKIWRVNNTPGVNADFSDITTAISTASAGDTLYIEGSPIIYEKYTNIKVNKSLCLIGPGYFLAKNDSTLSSKSSALISSLTIQNTATNTIIQGLEVQGDIISEANNVKIQKNKFTGIGWAEGVTSLVVQNNYITGNIGYLSGQTPSIYNLIISNNIILGYIAYTIGSSVIENNTILSNSLGTPWMYGENVGGLSIHSVHSVISNNLCKGNIYVGLKNMQGVYQSAYNTLSKNSTNLGDNFPVQFIGGSIEDKYYMLSPTSSAKGAGTGGVDCGAFGGSDPYVLSGLPAIPHIYDVVAPTSGSATSGIAVKIKVKTQK